VCVHMHIQLNWFGFDEWDEESKHMMTTDDKLLREESKKRDNDHHRDVYEDYVNNYLK